MEMRRTWRKALTTLKEAVFPRRCEVCGRLLTSAESFMCLHCELDFPSSDEHTKEFSSIHERMASHPPVCRTAAMFNYVRHDPYTHLIHAAKYYNRPQILTHLTGRFATRLLNEGFFEGIDAVQAIPMHWWKQLRRGYNQAQYIADAISDTVGLPVTDVLTVTRSHGTQTRRSNLERWINASRSYAVTDAAMLNDGSISHLLLVDDVITTGSTIKACAMAIHEAAPQLQLSILTLGVTRMI